MPRSTSTQASCSIQRTWCCQYSSSCSHHVGLGGTMAQWCITPCSEVYSLAPTFTRSSKALRSSRVIPANNPFHSCKYSTGTSRTIWYVPGHLSNNKQFFITSVIHFLILIKSYIEQMLNDKFHILARSIYCTIFVNFVSFCLIFLRNKF